MNSCPEKTDELLEKMFTSRLRYFRISSSFPFKNDTLVATMYVKSLPFISVQDYHDLHLQIEVGNPTLEWTPCKTTIIEMSKEEIDNLDKITPE